MYILHIKIFLSLFFLIFKHLSLEKSILRNNLFSFKILFYTLQIKFYESGFFMRDTFQRNSTILKKVFFG